MINFMTEQDWSGIDWDEGLPEPRLFKADELPLNKDKRYAIRISAASLRGPSGEVLPLRAQTSTGDQAPPLLDD